MKVPRARASRADNGSVRIEIRVGAVWFSFGVEAARDLYADLRRVLGVA